MRSGRPPTLWCDLIVTDGPPVNETDLDHVGIERPLREKFHRTAPVRGDALRLGLESLDEQPADRPPLGLGLGDACERAQEGLARLDVNQRDVELVAEQPHHLFTLPRPEQPMIDEDAGELVADRLMDQHRGHCRIDAARQPADHAALADAGADRLARLGAERRHRPVALQPGDLVDEIADQSRAVGRMGDLGMEHQAVVAARLVGDQRERRVLGGADRARNPGGSLVMRSPWLIQTTWRSPGFQRPSSSGLVAPTVTSARPNSR